MKVFLVTQSTRVNKKTTKSRVVGFVSVFGWESAEDKARAKYPFGDLQVHERPKRWG